VDGDGSLGLGVWGDCDTKLALQNMITRSAWPATILMGKHPKFVMKPRPDTLPFGTDSPF